jgi:RND family efflux transporter MFP subunit
MGRKLLPILGAIIVLTGIGFFRMAHSSPISAADPGSIKFGTAGRQNFVGIVEITGIIDVGGKSILSSQVSGIVDEVLVKEGSKVKKGDILASLDKHDFQVQLNQAQINMQKAQYAADQAKIAYDQAEADYDRSRQLYEAGVLAKSDFEQLTQKRDLTKSQYEGAVNTGLPSAQESLKQAQLALNKTDLISPVDGTVATCTINSGDFINANTSGPVITLVTDDKVNFAGNVNESLINDLKLGQKSTIQIDNLPGVNVQGEMSYISEIAIPTGQFFPVKITVQNADGKLKPGMTATAKLNVEVNNAVTVPKSAVFRRNGQTCVYVIKDNQAVKTIISIGLQGDSAVSVTEGITAGDIIVTEGTDAVMDGMTIEDVKY